MALGQRRFGVFELDLATGELRKRGVRVRLQEQPFRILEALSASPGLLVGRELLKTMLWPNDPAYRTDDNLNVAVKRLRRTLGDTAARPRYIETLRQRGYRFVATVESRRPVESSPTSRQTDLVGRRREIESFDRWLEALSRSEGRVVLVYGEPGIGKSRLAEEALALARSRGFGTTSGRCYESDARPPFVAFAEAIEKASRGIAPSRLKALLGDGAPELATLVPELSERLTDMPPAAALPPGARKRYLFNAIAGFVERLSHSAPLVFLLEDVHRGDAITLAMIEHLVERVEGTRLLVIATYRDTEVDESPDFRGLLEMMMSRRVVERVSLAPLERSDLAEMAGSVDAEGELVTRVAGLTGGNPFFAGEMFRHFLEDGGDALPVSVRVVVSSRLKRLGETTNEVLRACAILGRDFSFELLSAARGDSISEAEVLNALERAESARIIRTSPNGRHTLFAFEHEIIRRVIISDLSVPRRQRWHRSLAATLDRLEGQEAASEIAYHLYEAGSLVDPRRLARALARAAETAIARVSFEDALQPTERGLALEGLTHDERARFHKLRGTAMLGLGRWTEAAHEWEQAFVLFERLGCAGPLVELVDGLAVVLGWAARYPELVGLSERTEAIVGDAPTKERCLVLLQRAAALAGLGDPGQALRVLAEAEAVAVHLGDDTLGGQLPYYKSLTGMTVTDPRVEAWTIEAVAALRGTPHLWNFAWLLAMQQLVCIVKGRLDEAGAIEKEAVAVTEKVGQLGANNMVARSRHHVAWMRTGRLDEHLAFCRRNVELDRTVTKAYAQAQAHVAITEFWSGDWKSALESARKAMSLDVPGWGAGTGEGVFVLVGAYAGAPDALSVFERHRGMLPVRGKPNSFGRWQFLLRSVEALVVLGERDTAAMLYPLMLELCELDLLMIGWGESLIEKGAGISAGATGRWDEAFARFDTALRLADEVPYRSEQAEVRRWYAHFLIERGAQSDRARACELVRDAIAICEDIGMPRHVELSRSLLPLAESVERS